MHDDTRGDPVEAFSEALQRTLDDGSFARLVLAKPRADAGDLVRVTVRPLTLKGAPMLSFVHTHATRDVTKNLPVADALAPIRALIATAFSHAHLFSAFDETQLLISRKGKATLLRPKASSPASPSTHEPTSHDREKHRFIDLDRAFLAELGVTRPAPNGAGRHQLVPAMARKWKQINKFIEVLAHALDASGLEAAARIDVADFGSGKGYLTFAMHDYLCRTLGLPAAVAGVELRADMVALCNGAVQRLALDGLHFEQGDVSTAPATPRAIDIMIALHACDTATDHAIHTGVRAGAAIIMCSPCCHKELRPQLLSPHPMRAVLRHGVHLGQEAEMLTDSLRALLLDACGYDTQVFEFVALEHSQKNKMILAVRRAGAAKPGDVAAAWQQVHDVKAFYGVRDQCLERLLLGDAAPA